MKYLIILVNLVLYLSATGEIKTDDKTVQLKGNLNNGFNLKIYIHINEQTDSFFTDNRGNFLYKREILNPTLALIKIGNAISTDIFLAPGFSITMKADVSDKDQFFNSLLFTGIGSKANRYWKQLYLLYKNQAVQPLTNQWYDIPLSNFAEDGLGSLNLDSFSNSFNQLNLTGKSKEPFTDFFKEYSLIDISYRKLFYLFAYSTWNDLTVEQTEGLITKTIDPILFENLSHDNFLKSFYYSESISFFYLNYLLNKDIIDNEEILQNRTKHKLEIANQLYTGKTKEYVLSRIINSQISETFSFQELELLKSYINKITDKSTKEKLFNKYEDRKSIVNELSYGKDAPVFNLQDMNGNMYSLKDFKGKVVYIDLWASWCGPCKDEMPSLKIIQEEYMDNDNFIIISIAVKDLTGREKRNEFIKENTLDWLQLEDHNDFIWNKYKVTSIPRFILIDKEGKILNFDAPRPSEADKLRKEIEKAIAK